MRGSMNDDLAAVESVSASRGAAAGRRAPPRAARLEVFFDGDCPLCAREVAWLSARDRAGRLRFTDIAAPDFDPAAIGLDRAALMGRLHARTADGAWRTGMDALRAAWAEVGLGALLAPTGWRGLRPLFDALYALFALVRPHLPGRRAPACDGDRCAAPSARGRA